MEKLKRGNLQENLSSLKYENEASRRIINNINPKFVSLVLKQFFVETGKTQKLPLIKNNEFSQKDKKEIIGWVLDYKITNRDISKKECHIQLRSYANDPQNLKIAILDDSKLVSESLPFVSESINNCNIVTVKPLIREVIDDWKKHNLDLVLPNK